MLQKDLPFSKKVAKPVKTLKKKILTEFLRNICTRDL